MTEKLAVAAHECAHLLGDALLGATHGKVIREADGWLTRSNLLQSINPEAFPHQGLRNLPEMIGYGMTTGCVGEIVAPLLGSTPAHAMAAAGAAWGRGTFWTTLGRADAQVLSYLLDGSAVQRLRLQALVTKFARDCHKAFRLAGVAELERVGARLEAMEEGDEITFSLLGFSQGVMRPWSH